MFYQSLKVLLRRIFDGEFRKERREFLKHRAWIYDVIDALYDDFFTIEARRRKAELVKMERYYGIKHDNSFSSKPLRIVELP
jgi:hypothetical protein